MPPSMTATDPHPAHDSRHCGARTRAGSQCGRPAGWGTAHVGFGRCKLHGGMSPSHLASASSQKVRAEAVALLDRLGEPAPLGNPVLELLALGAKGKAWLEVCEERVSELTDFVATDNFGAEQARAVVRLFTEAMAAQHRLLADLTRLGLEERVVRLTEQQGAAMAVVIERVLARAGLDPQVVEVRSWVASELEALDAAS